MCALSGNTIAMYIAVETYLRTTLKMIFSVS